MKLSSANINVIIKACRKAAKPLIRDFGEIEKLQVSLKGPGDFVTASDKKVEKILYNGANCIACSSYIWNNRKLDPVSAINKFK